MPPRPGRGILVTVGKHLSGKSRPDSVTPQAGYRIGPPMPGDSFVRAPVNIPTRLSRAVSEVVPIRILFSLQRVHGFQTDTEPWRYGDQVESEVRLTWTFVMQLLPYIYSQAAAVTFHGSTMMRPLAWTSPRTIKRSPRNMNICSVGPSWSLQYWRREQRVGPSTYPPPRADGTTSGPDPI